MSLINVDWIYAAAIEIEDLAFEDLDRHRERQERRICRNKNNTQLGGCVHKGSGSDSSWRNQEFFGVQQEHEDLLGSGCMVGGFLQVSNELI
ncbi:MAG: hypothetical protein JWM11_4762 [Planctomycetaceae bacterium]|nr:hypothetical protein [Planctomycetaceae bacterium]